MNSSRECLVASCASQHAVSRDGSVSRGGGGGVRICADVWFIKWILAKYDNWTKLFSMSSAS